MMRCLEKSTLAGWPSKFAWVFNPGTRKLAATAMSGSKFFLYCGEKDEQWGSEMCQQINYANTQILKYGARWCV